MHRHWPIQMPSQKQILPCSMNFNHHRRPKGTWKLSENHSMFLIVTINKSPEFSTYSSRDGRQVCVCMRGSVHSWELTFTTTRTKSLSKSQDIYLWLLARLYRFLEDKPSSPSIRLCFTVALTDKPLLSLSWMIWKSTLSSEENKIAVCGHGRRWHSDSGSVQTEGVCTEGEQPGLKLNSKGGR